MKKLCSKCKEEKQFTEFSKDKTKKDGLEKQCKICRAETRKSYRENNKEKIKERLRLYNRVYRQDNIDSCRKREKEGLKRRIKDPNSTEKIRRNLRDRIRKALKGKCKSQNTLNLLGCNLEYFKEYISTKFKDNMTFENYGKWHIDHIIPCSYFDLSIEENQKICFHYTNLQPLWAIDNLTKSNKIINERF